MASFDSFHISTNRLAQAYLDQYHRSCNLARARLLESKDACGEGAGNPEEIIHRHSYCLDRSKDCRCTIGEEWWLLNPEHNDCGSDQCLSDGEGQEGDTEQRVAEGWKDKDSDTHRNHDSMTSEGNVGDGSPAIVFASREIEEENERLRRYEITRISVNDWLQDERNMPALHYRSIYVKARLPLGIITLSHQGKSDPSSIRSGHEISFGNRYRRPGKTNSTTILKSPTVTRGKWRSSSETRRSSESSSEGSTRSLLDRGRTTFRPEGRP